MLSPSQLTDLLLSQPSQEYVDCYSKRGYYDQALHRYFTTKLDEAVKEEPRELLFLASIYAGFNSEKITMEQFNQIEEQLRLFPVQAQTKKLKNSNLADLRKELFSMGIHDELISILK